MTKQPAPSSAFDVLPRLLLLVAATALAPDPARAADGVREINQSCFPGCAVISSPGSYVLTSDIVVTSESQNAIFVSAADVSIDLNGFELRGPTTCTGATGSALVCAPVSGGSEGNGVRAASLNVSVKNGRIRGMGANGVLCGNGCRVENVEIVECGDSGITAGNASLIRNNIVRRNNASGIGFTGTGGSRYEGNTLIENGNEGLFSGSHSVIVGNTAVRNGGTGLFTNPNGVVIGNTSSSNAGSGIRAVGGVVRENVVQGNSGTGLELVVSDTLYSDNVIDGNGATVTNGTQGGVNWCNTGINCP